MADVYDVCVIGAGVNGSSAAYELMKRGKKVLLLEQFPIPHSNGSSHGHSRIFRCESPDFIYSKAAFDSIPLWKELEKETGETLLIQNGGLSLYHPSLNESEIQNARKNLDALEVPYDVLRGDDINWRFPLFSLPPFVTGLYEHGAGMLVAGKCVLAFQAVFKKLGGTLRDCEKVEDIIVASDVTIKTNRSLYLAKSIIISAGSYAKPLGEKVGLDLPLKILRTFPCYWKLKDPSLGTVESGFPSFKSRFAGQWKGYGIASYEYPGLIKLCLHGGVETNLDHLNVAADIKDLVSFIQTYLQNVETEPAIVEQCLYTMTPDERFIIDKHPYFNNVVIAVGFSGQGFKMAPVTGRIIADLALGKAPEYDISIYKLDRFPGVLRKKASL